MTNAVGLRARRAHFMLLACAFSVLSCKKSEKELITLQVGPEQIIEFEVASGFAHYYEFPGRDDVLRVVLASYPLSCEEYEAPDPGEVFVTLTIRSPSPTPMGQGTYVWQGLALEQPEQEEEDKPLPTALEREESAEPAASALPFVRLAEDARALPPGGSVRITKFEPETLGLVAGELAFRDAGPGQSATTALLGRFSVRLCHVELDATRQAIEQAE